MDVDRKRSNVPEAVPDGASDGEVDGFDLDREAETVERVELGDIRAGRTETPGHLDLARDRSGSRQLCLKVVEQRSSES
jgi:hypothetical protein